MKVTKIKAGLAVAILFIATPIAVARISNEAYASVPAINFKASLSSSGAQTNDSSDGLSSMSKDGRYVAFESLATNLVASDTNNKRDIFVRDTLNNTTIRVSVDSNGNEANNSSYRPHISRDGRYVVFQSAATNLVASSDSNGTEDVFLYDMLNATTERISETTGGTVGNNGGNYPDVSYDGRYVVFESTSNNLVGGDTNNKSDIFVRDRVLNTLTRVNLSNGGSEANNTSNNATISCDGAFIAFESTATNLVAGDTNGVSDIFVVDRIGNNGITDVTISGNGSSTNPDFSCNGDTVAFFSDATNLVASDTNGFSDAFTYDLSGGSIERMSVSSGGTEGNNNSINYITISANGRCVVFDSAASNLVASDSNGQFDVFLRNRDATTTERVNLRPTPAQSPNGGTYSSVSPDGRYVTFNSNDSGLVAGDTNGLDDLFVAQTGATNCAF